MSKFKKKPVIIEAITFAEFVQYGKDNGGNVVNGMPWSFEYKGHGITHENDQTYLIPTLEGIMKFTPNDMLITGVNSEIYPCKLDIFEKTYEPLPSGKHRQSESDILKYFTYAHLPDALKEVSKPLSEIANMLDESLPNCAEKSAGMRKLLEAKDCFVRARMESK